GRASRVSPPLSSTTSVAAAAASRRAVRQRRRRPIGHRRGGPLVRAAWRHARFVVVDDGHVPRRDASVLWIPVVDFEAVVGAEGRQTSSGISVLLRIKETNARVVFGIVADGSWDAVGVPPQHYEVLHARLGFSARSACFRPSLCTCSLS